MALLGLWLAGCDRLPLLSPGPAILPPDALANEQVSGCGDSDLQSLIGEPFVVLANYRLVGHLRVLRPGQGVTRDLMPDRLNAQVDAGGTITRLFCG